MAVHDVQQRVSFTALARERELLSRYQKLQKPPNEANIEDWLASWETTYYRCQKAKLPAVSETRPHYDFLIAVKDIAPRFSGFWRALIQAFEYDSDAVPAFHSLVKYFRDDMAKESASGRPLRGQELDSNDEVKKEKEIKPCLCGKLHKFKTCWYLVESLRPATWKPDPEVQEQIEEKLQKSSRLRGIIERIQKKVPGEKRGEQQSDPADCTVPVFTSEPSGHGLRKSVILSSAANIHICNDRARFQTFRNPTEENFLYVANLAIPIEGFGSVAVTVTTPAGPEKIELKDAAYVPSLHTTVASLQKFKNQDVHLDTQRDRLTHRDETFCTLEWHYGLLTLEFQEDSDPTVSPAPSVS